MTISNIDDKSRLPSTTVAVVKVDGEVNLADYAANRQGSWIPHGLAATGSRSDDGKTFSLSTGGRQAYTISSEMVKTEDNSDTPYPRCVFASFAFSFAE
ncbi:MAG: hypothetical protein R2857_14095 [Vampirovibrionales bacterium]